MILFVDAITKETWILAWHVTFNMLLANVCENANRHASILDIKSQFYHKIPTWMSFQQKELWWASLCFGMSTLHESGIHDYFKTFKLIFQILCILNKILNIENVGIIFVSLISYTQDKMLYCLLQYFKHCLKWTFSPEKQTI